MNFATQDLDNIKLNTGFGAEATVGYRVQEHLSAFVGWSWNTFPSKDLPSKLDFDETGYSFGFQFNHPISTYNLNYIVGLAGIYNHIEVENDNGDIISDSGHGLGWQAETGLSYEINKSLRVAPTIRYRSLSRDIIFGTISTPVNLNYLAFNLAVTWCF
ncbi:outer membrane beta-barrel protein [Flavobacterium sp.]|uniref:outer membrane beta-barrel protein n=1 Tax=Flavobacterium sp. TaxID=239 RepID=UPI0037514360